LNIEYHVFWPQGFARRFDVIAAVIGLAALLALLRYKVGVIPVIAACGSAGLLFTFLKPWLAQIGVFS
jgi:chromate transporter